jgi:hypothetical protein
MIVDRLIFSKHLEEGEKILYAVHKHWTQLIKSTLEIGFFGFVIPWSLYLVGFNTQVFLYVAILWSVLAYIRYMYVLVEWYSNTWLITDQNVIVIEWKGLFNNLSSRMAFNDVEGATYEIKGFWGTMLRYGDMTLRVMSGSHATMKNAAAPKAAELAISKYQQRYLNEMNLKDTDNLKTLIANLVARQNRLR